MLLSKKKVREMVLYSYAQIDRLEKAEKFPKRVRLGPHRVGWVKVEIESWIEDRIAERSS